MRGFIEGVLYTNKMGLKKFLPCSDETLEQTRKTLNSYICIVDLPPSLQLDNNNNLMEGLFKRIFRKFGFDQTFTEPHSPWKNRAEPAIDEFKRHAQRLMLQINTPVQLWCFFTSIPLIYYPFVTQATLIYKDGPLKK